MRLRDAAFVAKTVSAALSRFGVRVISGAELRAVDEAAGEVSGGGSGGIGSVSGGGSPRGDSADLDFGGEADAAILGGLQVDFDLRGGQAPEGEQQDTVRSSTTSSTASTARQGAAAGSSSLSLRASLLVCADERDVDPVFFKVRLRAGLRATRPVAPAPHSRPLFLPRRPSTTAASSTTAGSSSTTTSLRQTRPSSAQAPSPSSRAATARR